MRALPRAEKRPWVPSGEPGEAACPNYLLGGVLLERGKSAEARPWFEQGVAKLREVGDVRLIAAASGGLASLELADGNAEVARQLLEEAEPVLLKSGDAMELPWLLTFRTELALLEGRNHDARELFAELERQAAPFLHETDSMLKRRVASLRGALGPED